MKILHIGKFYSPIEGGIESINQVIVEALRGNQQRVISFNNESTSIEEDVDEIPVIRASCPGSLASQPLSLRYFFEIRRAIRMFQPNIIHFHYPNPLGAFFLKLSIKRKNKLVVHWHSDIVAQKKLTLTFRPLEKWLLKRADAIIATSPTYATTSETLSSYKNKITVIPCSIKEDAFKKMESDEEAIRNIKNKYCNKPIVFFVGRHVEYKGIKYLLEAEKNVKSDCVFVIAGKGPLTENLKREYCSKRIHWLGKVSENEIRQLMYASEIFAFPSVTKNEAFGVALAEAMYCNCTPITFTIDGSGVNWVAKNNESAIEVENGNYLSYASAIDFLLQNPDRRKQLAENAHKRVEDKFTRESVMPQYIKLYRKLFDGKE